MRERERERERERHCEENKIQNCDMAEREEEERNHSVSIIREFAH